MYRRYLPPTSDKFVYSTSSNFHTNNVINNKPLYPIGPTLNQTHKYVPVYSNTGQNFAQQRPTSPFMKSRIPPPSYEQRVVQRQERVSLNPNYEERQKKLIALNEAEIEGENRRRESLKNSYEREIQKLSTLLNKNSQRKEKLVSEIEILEADSQQLKLKIQQANQQREPYRSDNQLNNTLEYKQEEILRLKAQMTTEMRAQEEQLLRERQQEQKQWEERLKEKEKILINTEQRKNATKNELLKAKKEVKQKILSPSIEDEIRQKKYQQFKYDFQVIREKINKIQLEREQSIRELKERQYEKSGIIKDQIQKMEQLRKNKVRVQVSLVQLQNRNKQIEKANSNLHEENDRKEKLIVKYETDTKDIKYVINKNQNDFSTNINNFRNRQDDPFVSSLEEDIEKVEKAIREIQNQNFRLKADYQKITELLNSSVSKSIYQTFNELHFM